MLKRKRKLEDTMNPTCRIEARTESAEDEEEEADKSLTTTILTLMNRLQKSESPNENAIQKIKYDPKILLSYLFDGKNDNTNDVNVIKVCKVRVRKTGGAMLAHYYARIKLSSGYTFEFHPGSQPRTFQTVHTDGIIILVRILCNECCRKELKDFVEGENKFNIAFQNCESILCKRKSMQTVLITIAVIIVLINVGNFSFVHVFFILIIIVLLYINNNYMIRDPKISICKHKHYKDEYKRF
ncbi:ORF92 [Leucania separata nucleopolyhedrovirus]|uniref:ORF92 n=1 Tax=Leucania separata nucleopolyhedrovirus TaxID=1307956 RepID=Q0IL27_NPVLS|nr:ORF92 [Leucania separata nucleopolyhedrovirus]AAR28856.1 ORF92 [Leucania separata nucleopolyhedrovirus]